MLLVKTKAEFGSVCLAAVFYLGAGTCSGTPDSLHGLALACFELFV